MTEMMVHAIGPRIGVDLIPTFLSDWLSELSKFVRRVNNA
jgi:hypothetical protein